MPRKNWNKGPPNTASTLMDVEVRLISEHLGRFPPVISSPSIVWSLTCSGKNCQRMTASPGNLLLHLQLCLCPCLDAGKLIVVLTLNFCRRPWPSRRLSSELSLFYHSTVLKHPHDDCPSCPWLPLHGCCLHNPSTSSALTKCWCSLGIPLSAHSLHHGELGPPAQPWHWWSAALWYCLMWLAWAVVSWEQLSHFRCFAVGNKRSKLSQLLHESSWTCT